MNSKVLITLFLVQRRQFPQKCIPKSDFSVFSQHKIVLMKQLFLLLSCAGSTLLMAQDFRVQPYLQAATPNSIYILWETESGEESSVEWGLTETLGDTTSGSTVTTNGGQLHEVQLTNLERFTGYHYRVRTGSAVSAIYRFKTPPFAGDEQSFRLLAMSDMQRDGNQPDKYREVVQDGVIPYLSNHFSDTLSEELALVMIPGDLVVNGSNYSQWEEHFFGPAQPLLSHVPVYPVPGNHENDSPFFFQYFHLPENGSAGSEEHWWYHDYGNLRIIGLDSNGPYRTQEQLDWLSSVLELTCENDAIDFVFAQLHHPHLSELWLPGEADFTGEVIRRLEDFSTDCGQPSIHFFGHTHGYSRGQSQDHKHLWVNVATAGGAIDHWGDYPQADYDEFSVSRDEWGFVTVDVVAGEEPAFTLKRISRGNETMFMDNVLVDSLTVRKNSAVVTVPTAIYPINELVFPECVTLKASDFSAVSTATHGQSHWQITTDCGDFSNPVVESWKDYQNLYFNEDTQAGDDLADERFSGLASNTTYCWRVRYRDRELNWSDWSSPATFTTLSSTFSANLLLNPGAENLLQNWNPLEGITEVLTAQECNGIAPYSGDYYFAVGGLCEESSFARCVQNVNVVAFADSIDAGATQAKFGGWLANFSGSDRPALYLRFLDGNGLRLDSTATFSSTNSNWTLVNELTVIPAQTRQIQMMLSGTRISGTDNDSYFDDLFLQLGNLRDDCSVYVTRNREIAATVPDLQVTPNPWKNTCRILLPATITAEPKLYLVNELGQKTPVLYQIEQDSLLLQRGNLPAGVYFFTVRAAGSLVGNGRLVVE